MPLSPITSKLPLEVELAVEVMPCQAMRRSYDSAESAHPCGHFPEWGYYHSYDYGEAGPPAQPTTQVPVVYAGKRHLMPEILSGCRKAPILCVGINPNLPGWTPTQRNAIHPYFDDVLQYAHYFRYRTHDKLRVPEAAYEKLLGTKVDDPSSPQPLTEVGSSIPVEAAPVLMYRQYQTLLDELAVRRNWANHKLSVGEDIAYANMVGCPSARWVVRPDPNEPAMPPMGEARAKGIVGECFFKRRYFLRQLMQSLPPVILVFSRTTATEFIAALGGRFSIGDPRPDEPLEQLFGREIRLRYGTLTDGSDLDARVIFMPHASARPEEFAKLRGPCVDRLEQELERGNLALNAATGHLRRGRGACVFCSNSLYRIGTCDYLQELQPLAGPGVAPLAAGPPGQDNLADRAEQLKLLDAFVNPAPLSLPVAMDSAPATPPPMVLRGRVVTMAGPILASGAVYIAGGRIAAVQEAQAPPPPGFGGAPVIDTEGVIYPGLMDLHNHLAYNILPLWQPPRRFDNRSQWQRRAEYRRDVTGPMKLIAGAGQDAVKAIIRYIEVKLLLGGVTSGQGMRSSFGSNQFYRGLVRNFEAPHDAVLPQAGSRVLDLEPEDIAQMKASLDNGRPFYFHLAEGLDAISRRQFVLLSDNGLMRKNLLCIHSLALNPEQHAALAQAGARVVWSPLSNSLLYGSTIDARVLSSSHSAFGLGSDWTPSGSRNILQELKVAWLCSRASGGVFDDETLVKAVTSSSAAAAGWNAHLGTIEADKLADLVIIDPLDADPYQNLIRATERNVRLVVIGGQARHGDQALMQAVGLPTAALEEVTIGGRSKQLYLRDQRSPLSKVSFGGARDRLVKLMSDLVALRAAPQPLFEPLSNEPRLELELDMQADEFGMEPMPFADLPALDSIALDAATVVDDAGYFDRLEAVGHLPAFLKGANGLRGFYQ